MLCRNKSMLDTVSNLRFIIPLIIFFRMIGEQDVNAEANLAVGQRGQLTPLARFGE